MRKELIPMAIALSLLISGCYPTGETPIREKYDSTQAQSEISNAAAEIINLTVDLELPENYNSEIPTVVLSPKKWDNDEIIQILLGNEKITEEYQTPSDFFPGENILTFITEKNHRLTLETGRISFYDMEFLNTYAAGAIFDDLLLFDYSKTYNNLSGELEGLSKLEAVSQVEELLQKFGISHYEEPEIYAVTYDTANDHLSRYGRKVDTLWTKDNEIYCLDFHLQYEGLPLSEKSTPIMGTEHYGDEPYIHAIVSRQGIVSLNCSSISDENYEKKNIETIKISPQDALDLLMSYYSKIELKKPNTVTDCRMVYLASAKDGRVFTYSPFWQFTVIKEVDFKREGDSNRSINYEYFDVVTGTKLNNYNN